MSRPLQNTSRVCQPWLRPHTQYLFIHYVILLPTSTGGRRWQCHWWHWQPLWTGEPWLNCELRTTGRQDPINDYESHHLSEPLKKTTSSGKQFCTTIFLSCRNVYKTHHWAPLFTPGGHLWSLLKTMPNVKINYRMPPCWTFITY